MQHVTCLAPVSVGGDVTAWGKLRCIMPPPPRPLWQTRNMSVRPCVPSFVFTCIAFISFCSYKQCWHEYHDSIIFSSENIMIFLIFSKYTSLFHQRNGSSKNTCNTANKENAISKHKVNMTIISTMKN